MKKEEYGELLRMEDSPWTQSRKELILHFFKQKLLLKGKILDVGCGMGGMTEFLKEAGFNIMGIDKHKPAVQFAQKRGLKVQIGRAEKIPFKNSSFNALIASDLLEHLNNPEQAIVEFSRVLKPNGLLLICVPAFDFLWSSLDESAQHIKRYTLFLVKREVGTKFKPIKLSYIFFSAFFPIFFLRIFRKTFKEKQGKLLRDEFSSKPKIFNAPILFLFRLENYLLRWLNFPIGVGIIGVFRNKKQ